MKVKLNVIRMSVVGIISIAIWLLFPNIAAAHCDTLGGPVVMDAKVALEKGDVTPVLKWIKKEYEAEIRGAFKNTLMIRVKGPEAKEFADMYFFETLVRLHRAGEGAPYAGLKPAGTELEPAVVAADKALASGSVDNLVKLVMDAVVAGTRERFVNTVEKKKHENESVEAGREFVEAYVEFTHYVERLHLNARGRVDQAPEGVRAEGRAGH